MEYFNVLSMLAGLSVDQMECSNPSCEHLEQNKTKVCAACGIVYYCSRNCQRDDWLRHKPLCIGCRPFAKCPMQISNKQKMALDKYSMIKLPRVDEEYRRKHGSNHLVDLWMMMGLKSVQDMLSTNISRLNMEDDGNVENQLKRWQEVSPELYRFLERAQPGDIFCRKAYNPYIPSAPQQFRNTPLVEPMKLTGGTTIVDVGFVDFGMTFDSIMTLDVDDEPLHVVGFEASPHCVSKTLVMLQMMKNKDVVARSIVEVWLSSLWSEKRELPCRIVPGLLDVVITTHRAKIFRHLSNPIL
jgi:hypothetical protein